MKRLIIAVATIAFVIGGAAAIASASGAPEINSAKATIQLAASKFVPARCAGEDGISYITYRGSWKGGETDGMPGSTDYNLSGSLTVTHVVWTVNLKSERGVLRGVAELVSQAAAGGPSSVTYAGSLTLITQGLPSASTGRVTARGWINAATRTDGKADGGSLLANVEFEITPGFAANGEFGSAVGFPDYSVADNNLAC